ncbi:hypothetical protein NDU88_003429 [Pleurodeles waltl]|uniref:Uncharacterized protein n=1 Tax=Pleurodeles waltl TaxID=8319 RepID=A0AAV7NLF4_PLEWA|nr:hypothetical protein NDU88_003429 [Pleurodeles waltl]
MPENNQVCFLNTKKKEEKLAAKERLATMASGSPKRRLSDTARSALNRYLRLPLASLLQPQLSGGFLIPQAKRNSNSNSNSDFLERRPQSSDSQTRRVTCHVSSASPVSRPTRAHGQFVNWPPCSPSAYRPSFACREAAVLV